MHDIRSIRDDPTAFDAGLASRGLPPLSTTLLGLDEQRRAAVSAAQAAQERRNALSKEIGAAKKARDEARAAELMAEVARLKDGAPELDKAEREASEALRTALAEIPNTPGAEVPKGSDEHGNVERKDHGFQGRRSTTNAAKQHFELGEAWKIGGLPLMDFDIAAKLSGSRFVVLRGQLARLERALGQFMLDLHTTEHGYLEVAPPLMVRDEVMFGTAQLPKFREDQYFPIAGELFRDLEDVVTKRYIDLSQVARLIRNMNAHGFSYDATLGTVRLAIDNLHEKQVQDLLSPARNEAERGSARRWLIPTAEVPLTNLVREQILPEADLPLRFAALTPCFRAEAGAAGRDTRGMLRQHQFQKCELVSITTPDKSAEEHERMLACAEAVLKKLDLSFRVMTLCTGDMGFASTKTYDIEVWLPGQGAFREISSCSVCGDFQARRMEARYRPTPGTSPGARGAVKYVHTLNGSGVAVGRALIAVLENYQEADGSVTIPSALRPYMSGLERIGD